MYNNSMKTERGYLLIVEDDLDILKLLETTLNFSGYRVVTARNGNEGLDAVLTNARNCDCGYDDAYIGWVRCCYRL